jgi:hypothetical protein
MSRRFYESSDYWHMHALEWFFEFFVLHFVEVAEFSACMHNTKMMMMGTIFICISTPLDFEIFFLAIQNQLIFSMSV